jgi:anti-anti-sigma factor
MSDDPALESPLTVERVDAGARPRIVVRGEMDAFTAGDVRSAVVDGTDSGVDLDLRGVTFMDSSGLGTLIVIHQVMEASGRRVVITGRSPIVQRLFELSGVTTRFHLGDEATE